MHNNEVLEIEATEIEELLKGKTMKIYWFLLNCEEAGVREIQRQLKFSSPSIVTYHLKKLLRANLIKQIANDKYTVDKHVKTGILSFYTKFGRLLIPRYFFYVSFFLAGAVCYPLYLIITGSINNLGVTEILFIIYLFSGALIFLYEAYRIWDLKPI